MKVLISTLSLSLLLLFYGCASTTLIEGEDVDQASGDNITYDRIENTDTTGEDAGGSDADGPEDIITERRCDDNESCNEILTEEMLCSGYCIYQEDKMSCGGYTFNTLCYKIEPPQKPLFPNVVNDIHITAPEVPEYVFAGDRLELSMVLENLGNSERSLNYSYKNPGNWEIFPLNFDDSGTLNFKPNESKTLRFNANAIKPNIFTIS